MDGLRKFLAFLSVTAAVVVLLFLFLMIVAGLGAIGLPLLLILGLIYGWMLFAFLHYRAGRQDELMHLLVAATEANAPLAPALRAYLRDRPRGGWRTFWTASLLFFVVPGYYWLWYRRHNYERKVARVADLLENGVSLPESLQSVPGVVPAGTIVAVAVGESTGRLAVSLTRAMPGHLATVWLEAFPRLIYPLALVCFLIAITTFWMIFLLPKMMRIFHDFGSELPALTQHIAAFGRLVEDYNWVVLLLILAGLALPGLLVTFPELRRYLPILGRLDRMGTQSRILKMLGVLLESGKPAPEALRVLASPDFFPASVTRRLNAARAAVEQGEPLPDSLHNAGLLSASMVPLVRAAERARHLPWALDELGTHLASRAVRLTRAISLALFPTAVLAVGLLVGVMVVGMFLPLVKLISEMA